MRYVKSKLGLILLFVFSNFFILTTHASLSFETIILEDEVAENVNTYSFEFKFKNTGNTPIEITKVSTTCGCTLAKCNKRTYEANEDGTISGIFYLSDIDGIQEKAIIVQTNDISNKQYNLTLRISIKRTISISPRILIWRVNSTPSTKKISIQTSNPMRITTTQCDSNNFIVTEEKKGKVLLISVAPKSTAIKTNSKIKIGMYNNKTKDTIYKFIFVLIK